VPGSTQNGQQAVSGRSAVPRLWRPEIGRLVCDRRAGFQHHCPLLLVGGFGVTHGPVNQVLRFAEISLVTRCLRERVMTGGFMTMKSGYITEIGGHG